MSMTRVMVEAAVLVEGVAKVKCPVSAMRKLTQRSPSHGARRSERHSGLSQRRSLMH